MSETTYHVATINARTFARMTFGVATNSLAPFTPEQIAAKPNGKGEYTRSCEADHRAASRLLTLAKRAAKRQKLTVIMFELESADATFIRQTMKTNGLVHVQVGDTVFVAAPALPTDIAALQDYRTDAHENARRADINRIAVREQAMALTAGAAYHRALEPVAPKQIAAPSLPSWVQTEAEAAAAK